MPSLLPTPGAKMIYLIKRRPTTGREELVAHWFANHMPGVIRNQENAAKQGRLHAWRYLATLFDANQAGEHPWDGMAHLYFDEPLPRPRNPSGSTPRDTFQQKAEPYMPWATVEYVALAGTDELKVEPLTLNDPFPCTRSGFYKRCFLIKARQEADFAAMFSHWLDVHVPNVCAAMKRAGGFRYCVSLSLDPVTEPYAGLAELYFPTSAEWGEFSQISKPDGLEQWIDPLGTLALTAGTEMIGIP